MCDHAFGVWDNKQTSIYELGNNTSSVVVGMKNPQKYCYILWISGSFQHGATHGVMFGNSIYLAELNQVQVRNYQVSWYWIFYFYVHYFIFEGNYKATDIGWWKWRRYLLSSCCRTKYACRYVVRLFENLRS